MTDGRTDFDFIFGRWRVRNEKLRDPTDPSCDDWVEFDATSEAFPLLGGVGHLDRIFADAPPGGHAFEAFTLRLFDPSIARWSIYWSSTRAPGRLDPPVVGGFEGDVGVFEGDDEVAGRPVKLRFEWHRAGASPTWRQFFSYDAGASWFPNWTMRFTRADGQS